jgi:hypothetical protein
MSARVSESATGSATRRPEQLRGQPASDFEGSPQPSTALNIKPRQWLARRPPVGAVSFCCLGKMSRLDAPHFGIRASNASARRGANITKITRAARSAADDQPDPGPVQRQGAESCAEPRRLRQSGTTKAGTTESTRFLAHCGIALSRDNRRSVKIFEDEREYHGVLRAQLLLWRLGIVSRP